MEIIPAIPLSLPKERELKTRLYLKKSAGKIVGYFDEKNEWITLGAYHDFIDEGEGLYVAQLNSDESSRTAVIQIDHQEIPTLVPMGPFPSKGKFECKQTGELVLVIDTYGQKVYYHSKYMEKPSILQSQMQYKDKVTAGVFKVGNYSGNGYTLIFESGKLLHGIDSAKEVIPGFLAVKIKNMENHMVVSRSGEQFEHPDVTDSVFAFELKNSWGSSGKNLQGVIFVYCDSEIRPNIHSAIKYGICWLNDTGGFKTPKSFRVIDENTAVARF